MPKAYWIAHVDVRDAAVYDTYRAANAAPFAKYGAKFLVRAGAQQVHEGAAKPRTRGHRIRRSGHGTGLL
jgi:uncharacterized protein (DUF1330 family)